jgi:hypothetical protein
MDTVRFRTGYHVEPVVASETAILSSIERHYGSVRALELKADLDKLVETDPFDEDVEVLEEGDEMDLIELEKGPRRPRSSSSAISSSPMPYAVGRATSISSPTSASSLVVHPDLDAAVLGEAALGDVELRHDLDARDDPFAKLHRRGHHDVENPVDPETHPEGALSEASHRLPDLDSSKPSRPAPVPSRFPPRRVEPPGRRWPFPSTRPETGSKSHRMR